MTVGFDFLISSILILNATAVPTITDGTAIIPNHLYPTIETKVDRNEILIGDVLNLIITITRDPTVQILERGRDFNLGQFEIKDIHPGLEEKQPDGKTKRTDTYQLSTYFTGEFDIPPFDIRFRTDAGQTGTLRTNPIKINVHSLTPQESENLDIRDIKPQLVLSGKSRMPYLLGAIAGALFIAGLTYIIWRRYKNRGVEVELTPPLPPHEQALQALRALRERKDLIAEKKFKEFAIILSDIMRVYIHRRWGITAEDETSYEILQELAKINLAPAVNEQFIRLFSDCDLMKFAKHEPSMDELDSLITQAEQIVEATKEQPILEPAIAPEKREAEPALVVNPNDGENS